MDIYFGYLREGFIVGEIEWDENRREKKLLVDPWTKE